jgi:AraC-like DNA-binding protein
MKSLRTVVSENFFRRFRDVFEPHLASLAIDSQVLERADVEIPGEQYIALWEAAGRSNPNIGLELGMQTEASDFGALGHALHCAPSIEMALKTVQKFIVVFAQESSIDYEYDARTVRVAYQINGPTIVRRRQDSEFSLAAMLRQFNLITRSTITPVRVDFEHDRPADTSAHKRIFQCPVYFNQPLNQLHFSREVMRMPAAQGNERLYLALEPYLERERQERSVSDELLSRITRMIAAGMSSGVPSLAGVSDQLGFSQRTLQRRLKDQGIEFSSLVEDVRRELALAYVKDAVYSITEVSLLVGYAESGSFTRAFRRWTGQSPQQYRATHPS